MGLAIAVCSGFLAAVFAPPLTKLLGRASGSMLALLPLGLAAYFGSFYPVVKAGTVVRQSHDWADDLGVNFSFQLDGLALLFALLITGIGALVFIYAGGYLAGNKHLGRLYCFLMLFMASMLGVVLSDNVLLLFVFWELTSFSSYLLIGFKHEDADSRAAALQALLVTGGGGLALMAGCVLLGLVSGQWEFSDLLEARSTLAGHHLYLPVVALMVFAAATKSAQFPFHFWLPGAMAAPTPVSAYLHSATMVKAGVYLLARLTPILGGTLAWQASVTAIGGVTLLAGAYLSLTQTDLKLILAYSTVSALGGMTMLLGVGDEAAITACMAFLLAHALYKGAMFMLAGAIDHETGTRDVLRLGGLRRTMPITFAVALIAGLSMAGIGPVLNFMAKELVLEALWGNAAMRHLLVPIMVLAAASFVAVAGLVAIKPFLGPPRETPQDAHDAPPDMWLGPLLLGALGIAAALVPEPVVSRLLASAATAVTATEVEVKLALWHGWNIPLGLSAVSLALGVVFYLAWPLVRRVDEALSFVMQRGPQRWYSAGLGMLESVAWWQTRLLQNGYLRLYLLTIFTATIVLVGATLADWPALHVLPPWQTVAFYEAALAALIVLAAIVAALARSRFTAIASLGVVGYSVALLFVMFGAPDLAMTQFLVETLTVIVFLLVFYYLSSFTELSSPAARLRDVVVSLAFGSLMTLMVLAAVGHRAHPTISPYYLQEALPGGHGANVVNVILVDFRGFDTMGEICVLALAGSGVYALIRLRSGRTPA